MVDLNQIIGAAADDADNFLAHVTTRAEARAAIRAYLTENHPDLKDADVPRVVAGLMVVLDDESFFDVREPREFFESDDAGN